MALVIREILHFAVSKHKSWRKADRQVRGNQRLIRAIELRKHGNWQRNLKVTGVLPQCDKCFEHTSNSASKQTVRCWVRSLCNEELDEWDMFVKQLDNQNMTKGFHLIKRYNILYMDNISCQMFCKNKTLI